MRLSGMVTAVDAHAGGEPGRVIVGGVLDVPLEVRSLGTVAVDVAYGGMFYVIADAAALGLRLTPDEGRAIVRIGEMIKAAAREQYPVTHPENPQVGGFSVAQLSGAPH